MPFGKWENHRKITDVLGKIIEKVCLEREKTLENMGKSSIKRMEVELAGTFIHEWAIFQQAKFDS